MKSHFSYSEMSLWKRSKPEYIRQYVKGETQKPNSKMILGTIIHQTLENPQHPWIKEMREHGFTSLDVMIVRMLLTKTLPKRKGDPEVALFGEDDVTKYIIVMDDYNKEQRTLADYKTQSYDWTAWRVHRHPQFSFYAYVYYLNCRKFFREITLHSLNTQHGTVKTFDTMRGILDIENIKQEIHKIIGEIKREGLWEKRLSREERVSLAQRKLELPT